MKRFISRYGLLVLWSIVRWWISLVYAQNTPRTPLSIKDNCLLTQEWLIDECPAYREDLRDINHNLAESWIDAEHSGHTALLEYLNQSIKDFGDPYTDSQEITEQDIFVNDYKLYITQQFRSFVENNRKESNLTEQFFEKSYFDLDQSGLAITRLGFYNDKTPRQYDPSLQLLLSLRNFSSQKIDTQAIYCFSTTAGRDYMYPLVVQPQVDAHSINNLVLSIDLGIAPLLDKLEKKWLACIAYYYQDNTLKHTNRSTLSFELKS